MGPIRLEVVSPSGAGIVERGLDEVVFRRREDGPEEGSLVSILPHHGSMLARSQAGEIEWRRGSKTGRAHVGAGIVEVLDERVLFLESDVKRAE